ncbi:MAG: HEAT repeat-containing PBS lyase [Erysipelotrichaceae bacterium]|nr:MAG: HEAT repeat-containing PBS [Erysipelotrichaceae bacterium]TXT18589.1 MAG: HEAT repeat-containing PBS lyase [Erysipelotrichaceae bacterium]
MGFFKLNVKKMAKNKDIKGLAKALMDRRDLDTRNEAAQALDEMKDIDKIAYSQFAEMLIKVRCDSLRPLSKLDPKLQSKLKNSDMNASFIANKLLHNCGDVAIEPLVNAITGNLENLDYKQKMDIRILAGYVIQNQGDKLPPAMIERLLSSLNSPDETVVRSSAFALARVKKDHVTDALIGLLHNPATLHLGEVAWALQETNNPRAIDPLISAIQHGATTREFSKALASFGDPKAVEPLLNVLKSYIMRDDNIDQPSATIYALSQLKDKRVIEPFIAFLSHQSNYEKGSESTRSSLAIALGDIGDESAVLVLVRTLNTDPNDSVRYYAAKALGRLAERGQLDSMIEIARTALQASSGAGSESVRIVSLESLTKFPKKVEIKPVVAEVTNTINQSAQLEEQLSDIISNYAEFAMIEEIAKLLVDVDRKSNKEYNVNPEAYKTTLKSIKHIGTKLNHVGGMQLMIKVLTQAGQYGCNTRFVEREWDGIGSWRG